MDIEILAFIPARKGSKGIPGKNMVDFMGRPLIHHTLDTVSQLRDLVSPFISTDCEEIAGYCSAAGFETCYRRPENLATDTANVIDSVNDGLKWLAQESINQPKHILLLQPTNPVRESAHIREAIQHYKLQGLRSLVSVTHMREHPFECVERLENGKLEFLRSAIETGGGRQQYPSNFFFIDGSFYLNSVSFIKEKNTLFDKEETKLFVNRQRWSVDIDEIDDIEIAKATYLNVNR